jgi:molybdopterin synthase catalytic subunit
MSAVVPPADGESWIGLSPDELPHAAAVAWATRPDCGAVVSFLGTARDHSPGRDGVVELEYEAYEEQAVPRLVALDAELRSRWPEVRRVALLHRTGPVALGSAAVVVVVSSAHRDAAFEAARFAIDELKASVPIWKRERWATGQSWGLEAQHVRDVGDVAAGDLTGRVAG